MVLAETIENHPSPSPEDHSENLDSTGKAKLRMKDVDIHP